MDSKQLDLAYQQLQLEQNSLREKVYQDKAKLQEKRNEVVHLENQLSELQSLLDIDLKNQANIQFELKNNENRLQNCSETLEEHTKERSVIRAEEERLREENLQLKVDYVSTIRNMCTQLLEKSDKYSSEILKKKISSLHETYDNRKKFDELEGTPEGNVLVSNYTEENKTLTQMIELLENSLSKIQKEIQTHRSKDDSYTEKLSSFSFSDGLVVDWDFFYTSRAKALSPINLDETEHHRRLLNDDLSSIINTLPQRHEMIVILGLYEVIGVLEEISAIEKEKDIEEQLSVSESSESGLFENTDVNTSVVTSHYDHYLELQKDLLSLILCRVSGENVIEKWCDYSGIINTTTKMLFDCESVKKKRKEMSDYIDDNQSIDNKSPTQKKAKISSNSNTSESEMTSDTSISDVDTDILSDSIGDDEEEDDVCQQSYICTNMRNGKECGTNVISSFTNVLNNTFQDISESQAIFTDYMSMLWEKYE